MRIESSVVVITGATSGIGRATASALARAGARLVLVARDGDGLVEVAAQCAQHGHRPEVVAVDVVDADAVDGVAERAVQLHGRLDAWVNAASVMVFGAFQDIPLADIRRVLDVNLMGYVHGCRAALPRMIGQGGGIIVNVSSILGVVAAPYSSAYTMAKFAVRGLGLGLRQELRLSGARGVHVCTVLPAAIDTPIFANAANHSGRSARAIPPVYTPERVAATITGVLRRPRREVIAGGVLGRLFVWQHRVWPASAERLLAEDMDRLCLSRTEPADPTSGNLYRPAPGRVHGGWRGAARERLRGTGALLAVAAAAALVRRRVGARS
ncbi:SDR family oxidoreductase [Pseudonocardia sp. TRM90224]|uniref:SDR family oxidoreductase n=1 Tax=Pseudonocardia sp. TRM90224 TaxID=2812678 RepID=UPI001E516DD5|nr:SDR family oxidoreductase [Pseudonocardia sp. TRM90224]